MLEHIPGLPDLILFWMNDVSVIRVSRCGITRGTLSGKQVLTLIWMIMTGGSFKIVSNWAVLTSNKKKMIGCTKLQYQIMQGEFPFMKISEVTVLPINQLSIGSVLDRGLAIF